MRGDAGEGEVSGHLAANPKYSPLGHLPCGDAYRLPPNDAVQLGHKISFWGIKGNFRCGCGHSRPREDARAKVAAAAPNTFTTPLHAAKQHLLPKEHIAMPLLRVHMGLGWCPGTAWRWDLATSAQIVCYAAHNIIRVMPEGVKHAYAYIVHFYVGCGVGLGPGSAKTAKFRDPPPPGLYARPLHNITIII